MSQAAPGPLARATTLHQLRLAVITSRYNEKITDVMHQQALEEATKRGAEVALSLRVAGVYDLPLIVDRALAQDHVDGAVALGAIVTGQTGHDEIIGHACAQALSRVAVARGKPIGLGVTGPRQTEAQAKARIGRAAEAVRSTIEQIRLLHSLEPPPEPKRRL